MLIKALCDYYDVLAEQGKVLPDGYSNVPIKYAVSLTPDGRIDEIISCQKKEKDSEKNGKIKYKDVAEIMQFPQRTEKSGIESNVIEHRPLYIFGLNYEREKLTPEDRTEKARKSHAAFVERNLEFIDGLDDPLINAFRNFLKSWDPEKETENACLLNLGKNYANSGFAFCMSGKPQERLHESKLICQKWETEYSVQREAASEHRAQCAVTGELSDIARLHSKIKGIAGGASTGGVLVGYNNPSECSYGNEQSYNSGISENAMKKYTEALNYILSSPANKSVIDDVTVAFWAMDGQKTCEELMKMSLSEMSEADKADELEAKLKSLMDRASDGRLTTDELKRFDESLDGSVDFYIAGFKPNSSRISVKFIYRQRVADILWNLAKFQRDMQVSEDTKIISLNDIKKECVSPNSSSEKINPELFAQLFKSVAYGTALPFGLLDTMIRRVKTDKYLNSTRAGVIKAYINRNEEEKEDDSMGDENKKIKLGLDEENLNEAYLYGRFFALVEAIQADATDTELNCNIKDKFFSYAMTRPALVFPKVISLSEAHMKKLKGKNFAGYIKYSRIKSEIANNLPGGFKPVLTKIDQGKFAMGYYHQMEVLKPSAKKDK